MSLNGPTLKADINEILSDTNISWNKFYGTTIMVTGATGLIGGMLVQVLASANTKYNLNLLIIAHGRDIEKCARLEKDFDIITVMGDIRKPLNTSKFPSRIDYIFHCAANTKSSDMVARPADVISISVDGTRNMLELAHKCYCSGFLYLSSMEVYGQTDLPEVAESDLGYLDLSNPRSSYPESKRLCEAFCTAWGNQYGLPVKIARLAQTFGAGTPGDDTRIFGQFARSVLAGSDIELHTEGKSRGNYCYISDSVRALFTILLKGKDIEAYNIANPSASATIREMADIVAKDVCDSKIKIISKIPVDIQTYGYAPKVGYRLNIEKLKALGWKPKYGLNDMYQRMLAYWQEQ